MVLEVTNNRDDFTGNASQTSFDFTFYIQQTSDLLVYLDEVLQTSGYSVTIDTVDGVGGTVVFTSAPGTGVLVTLIRATPITQTWDVPVVGRISEALLENAFDKLTMICGDLDEKASRAITLALGSDDDISTELPTPSALKLLRWNAAGTALENTDPVGDVIGPSSSTDNTIALWNSTTGALLKDGPAHGTSGHPLLSGGGSAPAFGALNVGTSAVTGTLPINRGGTGNASLGTSALGIIAGNGSGALEQITGAANQSWRVNSGASDIEAFTPITSIALDVSALPFLSASGSPLTANGTITLSASATLGDLIYASATNTLAKLAGNTTTTKKFLTQTGNGSVSAAPAWDTVATGDITSGTLPIARGGTNNGSLGVSALGVITGDGSKLVQVTGTASQMCRVNAGGTAIEFFTISSGDLPSHNHTASDINSGTLPIARGGTNNGSLGTSALGVITGNGSGALTQITGTASQFCRVNSGGTAIEFVTLSSSHLPSHNHAASDINSGTLPIARGGTNNGSLGVSALGIYAGDGSKLVQITGTAGQSFRVNAGGTAVEAYTPGGGSGDVVGPGSATDRTVALFNGTGGKIIKNGPSLTSSEGKLLMSLGTGQDPLFAPMFGLTPGHRLTLTSGTPVTTADVTAAGNIYWTPHLHNRCWLKYNDGTTNCWRPYEIDEISKALTLTNGSVYDVFVQPTSATAAQLVLLAWTNTTTRATAIVQDADTGLPVKSGAADQLYVGTIYATATNQTEDSEARRMVFNMFNRVPRRLYAFEPADSWAYGSAVWRSSNENTTPGGGRTDFVIGGFKADTLIDVTHTAVATFGGYSYAYAIGLAQDSTTTPAAMVCQSGYTGSSLGAPSAVCRASFYPAVGYHYIQNLEFNTDAASYAVTFWGDSDGYTHITNQTGWLMN